MSRRIENAKSYLLGQNTGDLETALRAFADDASYLGIEKVDGEIKRKLYKNKDEIRAYIGDWMRTAAGGITYTVHEAREYGDGVILFWSDVAKGDGEDYHAEGMLMVEFHDDDSIRHVRTYQDFTPLKSWSFLEREH